MCENTVSKKTLAINVRQYCRKGQLGYQCARIHVSEKLGAIKAIEAIEGIEGIEAIETIEAVEAIDAIQAIEVIDTIGTIEATVHSRTLLLFFHFL